MGEFVMSFTALRRSFFVLPCFFAVIFFNHGTGGAQTRGSEIFTVANISVEANADTPVAARAKAIVDGQRQALERMLKRITVRTDWSHFPSVDATRLEGLVLGFEVADERVTATRYMAKLTVAFRPDRIRSVLRDAGISFSETRASPNLLLAFLRSGNDTAPWELENPWQAAWVQLPAGGGLYPLQFPSADARDGDTLSSLDFDNLADEKLRDLAYRYNVTSVLLAIGSTTDQGFDMQIRVWEVDSGKAEIKFSQSYSGSPGPALLTRAAQEGLSKLEDDWKRETLLRFNAQNELLVRAPFREFQEWVRLRRLLSQVAEIQTAEILSLSTHEAMIRLKYLGDPMQLRASLSQRRLRLSEAKEGWQITGDSTDLPSRPQEIKQP